MMMMIPDEYLQNLSSRSKKFMNKEITKEDLLGKFFIYRDSDVVGDDIVCFYSISNDFLSAQVIYNVYNITRNENQIFELSNCQIKTIVSTGKIQEKLWSLETFP